MPRSRQPLAAALTLAGVLCLPAGTGAQQALNWSADDGARIETLARTGRRVEGTHLLLWHPPSLAPADADALVACLDPAIAALRARVGTHPWQTVRGERIAFYLSDDAFVSHASGRAAVFVPMARVKDGRAPYLHEATHELLASSATSPGGPGAGATLRRPLWLTEGLPDYIAQLVAADVGVPEGGPFASGGLTGSDRVCGERLRTPDGATMLPFVGAAARPDVLFTTDRGRFAPTFYACALSFTHFLVKRVGLDALVALFGLPPAAMIERLDTVAGRPLAGLRDEWQRAIASAAPEKPPGARGGEGHN